MGSGHGPVFRVTRLRRLHRLNAVALGIFIAAHLGNHLILIVGADAHLAFMDILRTVYRIRLVEAGIVLLFIAQIALGLTLAVRKGRPRGSWAWLQALSARPRIDESIVMRSRYFWDSGLVRHSISCRDD
jgi:hypothetical protein